MEWQHWLRVERIRSVRTGAQSIGSEWQQGIGVERKLMDSQRNQRTGLEGQHPKGGDRRTLHWRGSEWETGFFKTLYKGYHPITYG